MRWLVQKFTQPWKDYSNVEKNNISFYYIENWGTKILMLFQLGNFKNNRD